MTLQQAAQSALDVQNACNASGVLKSLANEVLDTLWEQAHKTGSGSRWVAQHPIVKLYMYKLGELTGVELSSLSEGYDAAEDACKRIASLSLDTTSAV